MTYLRTFAIIAILQILHCSIGYGQQINEIVIDEDTLFVMDRTFAELVAVRFDSLAVLKKYKAESEKLMDDFQKSILERSTMIQAQQSRIRNLETEQHLLYKQIDSYSRTENISETLRKQLRTETRKRKFWQWTTGTVSVAGIITSIYLITR